MNNVLDLELSNIIFGNICMVPPPNFGRGGISTPQFKTSEIISIDIEDDDGNIQKKNYPVWAASGNSGGLELACIDICSDNYNEFLLVVKSINFTFCIKKVYESNYCEFLHYVDKKFVQASLVDKLILAALFEDMGSKGAGFAQNDNISELVTILKEFVEYGS
jgi:hypothetical protein